MKTSIVSTGVVLILLNVFMASCDKDEVVQNNTTAIPEDVIKYTMPGEEEEHEGTWLQWPHNNTYPGQSVRYDQIWIDMTKALHEGETVYIIAYDENEKTRITQLLNAANVDLSKIDFYVAKTDDVWVRDNGPIFVRDQSNNLVITNWKFNGWGNKAPFTNDDKIPAYISNTIGIPKVDVNMVLEGGSIEVDGHGTLMATRSSILNTNRNPGLTQTQAESFFKHYLGITNFVWLDGIAGQDITDYHIDGFARFVQGNVLLTHAQQHMLSPREYEVLSTARNANGELYTRVELPIAIQSEGSYMNYYVGNKVVVVPNYGESSDAQANAIIQALYPNRTVVGVNVIELWNDGGAIHCVTQQQPKQ